MLVIGKFHENGYTLDSDSVYSDIGYFGFLQNQLDYQAQGKPKISLKKDVLDHIKEY